MASQQITKKRKFVADGVFYAELNEFFQRELAAEGYSGVEVRVTPARTEIIIRATQTQEILGVQGRRIRELTSLVQKRFKFPENTVELYAEKVNFRGLCAIAQCESLKYKLLNGVAVRRYEIRTSFCLLEMLRSGLGANIRKQDIYCMDTLSVENTPVSSRTASFHVNFGLVDTVRKETPTFD
ncbi:40S ribosomal protein S3, partial [Podila horticola]